MKKWTKILVMVVLVCFLQGCQETQALDLKGLHTKKVAEAKAEFPINSDGTLRTDIIVMNGKAYSIDEKEATTNLLIPQEANPEILLPLPNENQVWCLEDNDKLWVMHYEVIPVLKGQSLQYISVCKDATKLALRLKLVDRKELGKKFGKKVPIHTVIIDYN